MQDSRIDEEVRRVLEPGEGLVWCGSPKRGLLLRPSDGILIPFSLLWGGFAIFWELNALRMGAPLFFALWGVPFVLVGIYFIVGRFFVDAYARSRTVYGLTNRRAVVISGIFSKTTTSLPLRNLSDITLRERSDGSGTIQLARPHPYSAWAAGMYWPGMAQYAAPAFEMVADVQVVHRKILDAQRTAA